MAQGKLGATDKYPYMVTQMLRMHTQTDKLGALTLSHTCCFPFQRKRPLKSAFREQTHLIMG